MRIKLNQQQIWLTEQAAAAEGADPTELAAFLSTVVKRYLAERATERPAAA